jgi:starvation-inducible DNA-binding protein
LFETQYKQLNEISDKLAGRVRMLGGIAIASFEEFVKHAQIMEHDSEIPNNLHLLADHETVIRILRENIRKCSEEYEDEGTVELLVGVMSLHEKIAWMLRAYIENEPTNGNGQKRKS